MWFKVKRPALMSYPEDLVRQHALQHLAEVFRVPESSLSNETRFGQELKAAPASPFKLNEFDVIDDDIKDVADKPLLKEMAKGLLVIQTVGDYCEHMVRCSAIKPQEVARVLRLPAAE
ncbi:MAG: hypothetical protein H7340_13375 [Variovorax sp.]|nr:hypothetical protein [Variovorax sp.]